MIKWVEISQFPSPERYDVLSRFLNENGIPNQVEYQKVSHSEYPDALKAAMLKFDTIRIGRGIGDITPQLFNNNTVFIEKMGAGDAVVKMHGKWCLRSTLYEGMIQVCSNVGHRFELDSHALIVGAGAIARASIAALSRSGFTKFGISDQSTERGEILCAQLRKMYFGAEFRLIPKQELILLPGIFGVLVNTTPLDEGNEILDELTYFNFFRKNAIAFDYTLRPVDTPLLKEAEEVGVFAVHGYELAVQSDKVWVEMVSGKSIDMSQYESALSAALRA